LSTDERNAFDPGKVEFAMLLASQFAIAIQNARLYQELATNQSRIERELRTAQRGHAPNAAVMLDDEVVTRMLGEEAARILQTAREAGSQIKIRAEENAARLLREATDEAQRLREEAELESARRRQDASADAEAELQMAKQQGREMVNEARAYRERVLGELARRREMARQQIEQLVHGRDRLLQAFERARIAAVDVMAEMTPLGEPSEYVNLSPTTGPVPLMVPAQHAELPAAPADEPYDVATEEQDDDASVADIAAEQSPVEEVVVVAEVMVIDDAATDDEEPALTVVDDEPLAQVVALFAGEMPTADDTADLDGDSDPAPKASVDDLFARLRASRTEDVAERAATEAGEVDSDVSDATAAVLRVFEASPEAPAEEVEVDDTPFGQRDAELTPLIVAGARKLKRVLADEQNEVLHALRRGNAAGSVEALVGKAADHIQRYAASIEAELQQSALAGSKGIDKRAKSTHEREIKKQKAVQPSIEALATTMIDPLRERLDRAVADANGDTAELTELIRGIYREWKTQRIDEHLDDVVRTAYGHGALAGVPAGTALRWAVDPRATVCPDCDDNALAGEVMAGSPFPTDHLCAPAHPGCRCMLVRVPS
ncbi:MAG TPA: hypothetical protein VL916_10040, partial [Ilumatobacteraceae bacterium]|nr:hypothetical protein [Ilumatobacteraceae bacterium]